MPLALLALSMAPLTVWIVLLALVSLARLHHPPLALRSERLAGWSYSAAFCALWAIAILIVSLWPVAR